MNKSFIKVLSVVGLLYASPMYADDVTYNLNPTVSPKSMSEVERGAKVTLDFGEIEIADPRNVPVTATPQTVVDDGYDVEYIDGTPETLYLDVDSEGIIYFNFDVAGEAGALYKLSIARGAITSADGTRANMAKSWKYFLAEDPETEEGQLKLLSVNPAPESTIAPGTVINLYFSEDVDIETCTDAVTITNDETDAQTKVTLDWNWDTFDFSNVRFTFPKGLADGTYTATIPADLISGSYCYEKYGEISLKYIVASQSEPEPQDPQPVEVKNFTPASSEVQTLPSIIKIGFQSKLQSLADGAVAILADSESGKTYTGVMTILEYVEKTLKIEFDYGDDADSDGSLGVPGLYTLTIDAGTIFGEDGGTNPAITNVWTVTGAIDLNDIEYSSVLPRDGSELEALTALKITFPQSPALSKGLDAKIIVDGKEYDFTLENNRLSVTVSPEITEFGTYNVTLPAGSVYSLETGHGNKLIALTYQIVHESGIETLAFDNRESLVVYNCQGVCLMRNATLQDFQTLPCGLYVVNGKKVLKK